MVLVWCSGWSDVSNTTPSISTSTGLVDSSGLNSGSPQQEPTLSDEVSWSDETQYADPSLADMSLFVRMLNGTYTKVQEAVALYANTPDLASNDITIYDLANPKVVASNGACHTMEAEVGSTIRVYDICRQDSKINSITLKEVR